MSRLPLLLLAALSLSACERDPDAVLRSLDSARVPTEVLQDLRDDGARMFATVQPVPPNSDAPRAVIARWVDRDGAKASWSFDGIPVLDARFVPGSEAALVLTRTRELVLLPSRSAMPSHIDSEVLGPVSVSRNGRYVAYGRGEIPDVEIVRYDLARGQAVGGTQDMAPAWSPVLSEDGSRLLFVSGKTGAPELWELDTDHTAVQRTDRTRDPIPFPTGPSAPIWDRNTIAFEDNDGVRILSVDPPRLLRTVPGTLPLLSTRSRAFVVQDPAGLAPRSVSFDATEVVR